MGITTGLALSQNISASPIELNQQMAQSSDQYICATYNNCGLCGGKCNIKNPETPGFTPEQKKEAEEYQKKHKDDKKDDKSSKDDGNQVFCNAKKDADSTDSKNSEKMKAKRNFQR